MTLPTRLQVKAIFNKPDDSLSDGEAIALAIHLQEEQPCKQNTKE